MAKRASNPVMVALLRAATLLALAGVLLSTACDSGRIEYKQGLALLQAQQFGPALEKFDHYLQKNPDSNMALFGKARCLYELQRYDEALPCFEQFITQTDSERATFRDERFDAAFFRDKCKMELGIEVPQNPNTIPEEKMRY